MIPLQDIGAIGLVAFIIVWYYLRRVSGQNKIEIILMTPDGKEGRKIRGEDSLSENRVSFFRRISMRKKESLDFKRRHLPTTIYDGNRRYTWYLIYEKDGETSSWAKDKGGKGSRQESAYEDLAKLKALKSVLAGQAVAGFKHNMSWIVMGFLGGMLLTMILAMVFPQVF